MARSAKLYEADVTQFAVIAEDPKIRLQDAFWDEVVAALNIQASQHVAKGWTLSATVASYPNAGAVPATAIPIVVMEKPDNGVLGCHQWKDGHASAVVRWEANGAWSVAASHEIIETIIDPTLQLMRPGPNPRGGDAASTFPIVNFLVEACDPCAGTTYPAVPGARVSVSDFCLPAYYAQGGFGPFTYCNQAIHLWNPDSMVAIAGYATWVEGSDWYQFFGGNPHGPFTAEQVLANAMRSGRRGAVDRFSKFATHNYERDRSRSKPKGPGTRAKSNNALTAWVAGLRR